jgi:hypothetical protein
VRSVSAIDAAAASNTPAAARVTASIRLSGPAVLLIDRASDSPSPVSSLPPSACANPATDDTRRSGMISKPLRSVCSSSGVTPGNSCASCVGSP